MKKNNTPKQISQIDEKIIRDIYKLKSQYVNGVYITPIMFEKSTMVRLAFTENNFTLKEQVPNIALACTLEDLQIMYNAMTTLLQQMRELGRIM